MFKSHYVVWKQQNKMNNEGTGAAGLNRTM